MIARTWDAVADVRQCLARVHDPELFAGVDLESAYGMMRYLYAPPSSENAPLSLRSRVLALYDPFAKRGSFPAGFRLCCNVYTGCAHACRYCYISGYIPDPHRAREKPGFLKALDRDLADLRSARLSPVPLHVSNSTDFLQEAVDSRFHHALALLRRVAHEQELFGPITFLTKNPARLVRPEYLEPLLRLRRASVEVSLICRDDDRRKVLEPGAPSVESRLGGIRGLRDAGVRVSLRLDPLFPRDPLPSEFFARTSVAEYGAAAPHTWADIVHLVHLAKDLGCDKVIVSAMKVMCGRFHDRVFRAEWEPLYAAANGGTLRARGFAYRLPEAYIRDHLIGPVSRLGDEIGIPVVHCMRNLLSTQ